MTQMNRNMTVQSRKRIRDIENGWVVAKEKGSERGMDREFRLSKCKLVYIH